MPRYAREATRCLSWCIVVPGPNAAEQTSPTVAGVICPWPLSLGNSQPVDGQPRVWPAAPAVMVKGGAWHAHRDGELGAADLFVPHVHAYPLSDGVVIRLR